MDNTKLHQIKKGLYEMAFLDIKRASDGQSKMGAFILASCFIDQVAGFVKGGYTTRDDYKQFVKDYLPTLYDSEKLYTDLRCKLVHNYSEGGSYLFTNSSRDQHGREIHGKLIINLENFIEDLEAALRKLLDEIEDDPVKAANAERRLDEIGLLGVVTVPMPVQDA